MRRRTFFALLGSALAPVPAVAARRRGRDEEDESTPAPGMDGDLWIRKGQTVVLTRPMFFRKVTIEWTGKLDLNGHKVWVSDTLIMLPAPGERWAWA